MMNKKKEITRRYFDKMSHVKNYIDNYKPKTKSQIAHNLHIDNRLVYHLETNGIIKFNVENNHFVWNEKIPITQLLAETIGTKVTVSNRAARKLHKQTPSKKKIKISLLRRFLNWF